MVFDDLEPKILSNAAFNNLTEEEIDYLTDKERNKLESSTDALAMQESIETDYGAGGVWEEHWITVDHEGTRVFASIYYHGDVGVAVTADGRVVRRFSLQP